ncbi:activating transcription factor 7-interacting protein 1-like [Daktulosphaira vitifoliae]|uniref:activating transcription factor 7-interacting protein 1-like n=1 Tax=Daktulosphaira vitifoliae TaxID=58002 RepID=UPI0021A97D9B|nr:activating transcription factor 7-interacting protein 1-like [Daktulosphaira vitifoliae]
MARKLKKVGHAWCSVNRVTVIGSIRLHKSVIYVTKCISVYTQMECLSDFEEPLLFEHNAFFPSMGRTNLRYPPPLPVENEPGRNNIPPAPISLTIKKNEMFLMLQWEMELKKRHEDICYYELYYWSNLYENCPYWILINNIASSTNPMQYFLTGYIPGYKYYFAVRAVDIYGRRGHFIKQHIRL